MNKNNLSLATMIMILTLWASAILPTAAMAASYTWKDNAGKIKMNSTKPDWWDDCCLIVVAGSSTIVDQARTIENIANYKAGREYTPSQLTGEAAMYVKTSDDSGEERVAIGESSTPEATPRRPLPTSTPPALPSVKAPEPTPQSTPTPLPVATTVPAEKPTAKELAIDEAMKKDFLEHPKDSEEVCFQRIATANGITVDEVKQIQTKVMTWQLANQ